MNFLTEEDLTGNIDAATLSAAIKGDTNRYTTAETFALEMIRSSIGGKYDCDAIFAEQGAARHPLIVEFATSITIWQVLSRGLNPRNIPEIRKENYDQAISLLGKMANDKSNPTLPLKNASVKSTRVHLGGSKKVSHRW